LIHKARRPRGSAWPRQFPVVNGFAIVIGIAALISCALTAPLSAQELEPRAFSSAPVGVNFVLLSYAYSSGNVLLDPSLPVEDAKARVNNIIGAYVRTIGFLGVSGRVGALVPYAFGEWEGLVDGEPAQTTRSNFGDPRLFFAANFLGSPALSPRDFATRKPGTAAGFKLQVIVPLGEYDSARLINLGSNRWSFKPSIGLSQPLGKATIEGFVSVWLFTNNTNGPNGLTVEQDPILALQGHFLYSFTRSLWAAVSAGYGWGGEATVGGDQKDSFQKNTRFALTITKGIGRRHSLKFSALTGVSTRIGADFDSVVGAYQYRWGAGL